MSKLVLVDGNSILFRGYYATIYTQNKMTNNDGIPTNAVFAFHQMFQKIMSDENAEMVVVAFDAGEKTFRHEMFADYKGTRKEVEEDLIVQFAVVREYLKAYNVKTIEKVGYEADDIIGTLAKQASQKGMKVEIYSSDGDLLQLINDNVTVHVLKKGMAELEHYTPEYFKEQKGLMPKQVIDLKALMGDSSDNIPGVKGVGPKKATQLLQTYDTLENIYQNISELKGKLKENLELDYDNAFLSKQLATINLEVPIDDSFDSFKYQGYQLEQLKSFFVKYQFNLFLKQLNQTHEQENNAEITTLYNKFIGTKMPVALSLILDQENYHTANILGIGISDGKQNHFLSVDYFLNNEQVREWLENDSPKYVYDAKKIVVALKWKNIEIKGIVFDLLLASFIISTNLKSDFASVCNYFGVNKIMYESDYLVKKVIIDSKLQEYCAYQAQTIFELKDKVLNNLTEQKQMELYEQIELPLTYALADMEFSGVSIDKEVLNVQGEQLNKRIEQLTNEIYELAGETFLIDSPKQLGSILFEKLLLPPKKKNKTGYSTAADVLDELRPLHPIIEKIIDYRQLTKLYSTYIEGLKKQILSDGKIHTIFRQAEAQTGRLSSIEPNLQNIPIRMEEGRKIRKAFIASEKSMVVLSADYSQIELRVLAHMANAEELITAFNDDQDIHTKTAADIFEVNPNEVDANMRRQAKAINFGIIYGMSDFGLSEQVGVTRQEAKNFIERYFITYPHIKEYMDNIVLYAQQNEYVMTIFNRKRDIKDINSSNFMLRQLAKRLAMNSPIQGSAADIMKVALVKVWQALKESDISARVLIQVHDELVFEVLPKDIEKLKLIIKQGMEQAVDLKVKLKTDVVYGKTWYDAK